MGSASRCFVVLVHMGATAHHRRDRQDDRRETWHQQAHRSTGLPPDEDGRQGGTSSDRAHQGTGGVGELRCLCHLETVDPCDAADARGEPSADGDEVHCGHGERHEAVGPQQTDEAEAHLCHGEGDEDPCQLRVLGVDADGGGMHGAGAERGHRGGGETGQATHLDTLRVGSHGGDVRKIGAEAVPRWISSDRHVRPPKIRPTRPRRPMTKRTGGRALAQRRGPLRPLRWPPRMASSTGSAYSLRQMRKSGNQGSRSL